MDPSRLLSDAETAVLRSFFANRFAARSRDWLRADASPGGGDRRSFLDRALDAAFPGRAQTREFFELVNSDATRRVGNTSSNCYSNARSLARLGSAFVDAGDRRLLSSAAVQRAAASGGGPSWDVGLGREYNYSDGGLALDACVREGDEASCRGLEGFHGWFGIDGSCLLFNFRTGVAFSYVPCQFEGRPDRFRAVRLLKAAVASEAGARRPRPKKDA